MAVENGTKSKGQAMKKPPIVAIDAYQATAKPRASDAVRVTPQTPQEPQAQAKMVATVVKPPDLSYERPEDTMIELLRSIDRRLESIEQKLR
jgi:hypothetical protein